RRNRRLAGRARRLVRDVRAQYHDAAARGAERDTAPARGFGRTFGRAYVEALQQCAQDDLHLEQRKARAYASTPSAAEGDPRVRPRRALEEALGAERVRILVD